jgi:hypothetical protein
MHIATLTAFDDELQKIAAGLSAAQMMATEAKGLKRGWSGARVNKSMNRLMNRDARPAFRAEQATQKAVAPRFHSPTETNSGSTAVARRPMGAKPPPPVADPSHSGLTRTFVRPQPQKSLPWKRIGGGAALAAGAFGAGAASQQQ